jgi:hypothetical protein
MRFGVSKFVTLWNIAFFEFERPGLIRLGVKFLYFGAFDVFGGLRGTDFSFAWHFGSRSLAQ